MQLMRKSVKTYHSPFITWAHHVTLTLQHVAMLPCNTSTTPGQMMCQMQMLVNYNMEPRHCEVLQVSIAKVSIAPCGY